MHSKVNKKDTKTHSLQRSLDIRAGVGEKISDVTDTEIQSLRQWHKGRVGMQVEGRCVDLSLLPMQLSAEYCK